MICCIVASRPGTAPVGSRRWSRSWASPDTIRRADARCQAASRAARVALVNSACSRQLKLGAVEIPSTDRLESTQSRHSPMSLVRSKPVSLRRMWHLPCRSLPRFRHDQIRRLDEWVSHDLQLAVAYVEVLSALADSTRRHIFEAMREQPKTVGELARGQPVSRPAVSQRLKVIEAASLVSIEPRGHRRLYSIKRDGLDDLRQYLESFRSDALSAYGAGIARWMKIN